MYNTIFISVLLSWPEIVSIFQMVKNAIFPFNWPVLMSHLAHNADLSSFESLLMVLIVAIIMVIQLYVIFNIYRRF